MRGSPSQTPVSSSKKKLVSYFDSPFSVSSEESDLIRLDEKEDQLLKDPLETDLNSLFQTKDDLIFKKQAAGIPSQAHQRDIPDHLKSFVEKCGLVLA